jgi:hypothetical protein
VRFEPAGLQIADHGPGDTGGPCHIGLTKTPTMAQSAQPASDDLVAHERCLAVGTMTRG